MFSARVLIRILLLTLLTGCVPAAIEDTYEDFLLRMKRKEKPSADDLPMVVPLLERAARKSSLSILQQNVVYYYLKGMNDHEPKLSSPAQEQWKIYRYHNETGQFMAFHRFEEGNEAIYLIRPLRAVEPLPWMVFSRQSIKIFFDQQEQGLEKIASYDADRQLLVIEVLSGSDDFSGVLNPSETSLLFLTGRDRISSTDKRVSVYVKSLSTSSREQKVLDLGEFERNVLGEEPALAFLDDESFRVRLKDGSVLTYKLADEINKNRVKPKEENPNRVLVPALPAVPKAAFAFEVIAAFPVPDGNFKVMRIGDRVEMEIERQGSSQRTGLTTFPASQFLRLPGVSYNLQQGQLFYARNTEGRSEVHYLDLESQTQTRLSRRLEEAYSPVYNAYLHTAAYLLRRGDSVFVDVIGLKTMEIVATTEVQGIALKPGVEILRLNSDGEVSVLNNLGDWQIVLRLNPVAKSEKSKEQPNKEALDDVALAEFGFLRPDFAAPVVSQPSQQGVAKVQILRWQDLRVEETLNQFPLWITKVQSARDLYLLKLRYNQLHEQISLRRKELEAGTAITPMAQLTDWIQRTNGVRVLLDNTEILLGIDP